MTVLLEHYGVACAEKRAVVIGRSPVVGRPAAMLLLARNATVTVCHTATADLPAVTRGADIIVSAAGAAGSLTASHVRPGQTVIDVSVSWDAARNAMVGDAEFDAVSAVVDDTFNMVSVDGDTSTNDMLSVLANGLAGNPLIDSENELYANFKQALFTICENISKKLAGDGEGATKLLECTVSQAPAKDIAKKIAKSVICSSLFKTAMFGADANWGRILCAIGYTDAEFDISKISVDLSSKAGQIHVCENGAGVPFSEDEAKKVLLEEEVHVEINMHDGTASATAWGCDLTYDYVKINGDYRT